MKQVFEKIAILIVVLILTYLLVVFLFPSTADKLGDTVGAKEINETVRDVKTQIDQIPQSFDQIKDAAGDTFQDVQQNLSAAYADSNKEDLEYSYDPEERMFIPVR